jgi:hypothetical protein
MRCCRYCRIFGQLLSEKTAGRTAVAAKPVKSRGVEIGSVSAYNQIVQDDVVFTKAKTPVRNPVPAGFFIWRKMMTTDTDITSWLTLDDAASAMKTTKVHLLMMVKRGLVRGLEQDGGWFVDPKEIAALTTRPESGRVFNQAHCKGHSSCGGCK